MAFGVAWVALTASGCARSLDLEGKQCPCVQGYMCDEATNTCRNIDIEDARSDVDALDAGDSGDTPPEPPVYLPIQLAAGNGHTCVVFEDGAIRCWGASGLGQLGYGSTEAIGDDEVPGSMPPVDVGKKVTAVGAGYGTTCALLEDGKIRCWGGNMDGQLGQGHTWNIGDDEVPSSIPAVNFGGTTVVTQIAVNGGHICALLSVGNARCWGRNDHGQLGYGNTESIGDDDVPLTVGTIQAGGTVTQIAGGFDHTCALFEGGSVKCWGANSSGQLGYSTTSDRGDTQTPQSWGTVNIGGQVIQIDAGAAHTCALLQGGTVRCWGSNASGQLGYGNTDDIGDDEHPYQAGDVSVGGTVTQVAVGGSHTCALLSGGAVRCWGSDSYGQLGSGTGEAIGDTELPSSVAPVSVGGKAIQIAAGGSHTCALLEDHTVRCWGINFDGTLGYGHTDLIGDDEVPSSVDPVVLQ